MNAKKSEVVEESKQIEARRKQKKKERYGESEPYSNKQRTTNRRGAVK